MFDSFDTQVNVEEQIPSDYEEWLDEINRPYDVGEEALEKQLADMEKEHGEEDIPY